MSREVVINTCYGGFGLSAEAMLWIHQNYPGVLETMPAEKYFGKGGFESREEALGKWRAYQETGEHPSPFWTIFIDDNTVLPNDSDIPRDSPALVACVKTLGERANGSCAKLVIVEIPDDVDFKINEYDGLEHIAEKHRTWS